MAFIKLLCERKGISYEGEPDMSYAEYKESQYNLLADVLRQSLDMEEIYKIIGI